MTWKGFRKQSQYRTRITHCDELKEIAKNSSLVFKTGYSTSANGDFIFRLAYREVRMQITFQNHFLKLSSVKPDGYLDLKVIQKKLASLFSGLYPNGLDLKLDF